MKIYIIFIFFIFSAFTLSHCSDENPYKQGAILYKNFCSNCHMDNGEGLKGLIPPLANSDYWTTHRADLPCLVRKGIKGKMVVNGVEYGNQEMLGISRLTEFEITNIFNYINNSWGNQGTLWTGDEVRNALKNCE